ncbi:MAG: hypothetical protein JRC60_05690 [Deltaproteobacteria bacterium]|nr:hypothetical protein [Deltaproteobacteria bacterium]
MAFNKTQFQDLIERVLTEIGMHSRAAVHLLLGTAAQESGFGTYLRQVGGGPPAIASQPAQARRAGPALGVFQMEPATEKDIWGNYLVYREDLAEAVWQVAGAAYDVGPSVEALEANLSYQIAMARIHYRRVPEALPRFDDIDGMAWYWKQYYNTPLGKGTEAEFVKNYHKYITKGNSYE